MSNKFKNPYLQVTDQLTGGSEPKNPYLQHGWGNSAKAKQKEKEYNRKYYEEHKKDKWGVGVGTRSASAPKENKFANGLKRFGQSVNESLQKHNDNWQRGMDMILNKNVTSQTTPASTMQKKKVNPYKATGMAANAQSSGATPSPSQIAQAKKNATPSAQRANAYAQSEQARANKVAKNYRQQNASANRAKANAESAQAAEKQTKFRAEQYENAKKIEQMHKKFEADQNNFRWGKEKQAQQQVMDADQQRRELQAHSNHYKNEAKKQEEYKKASQYLAQIEKTRKTLDKRINDYTNTYREAYAVYETAHNRAEEMKKNLDAVKGGFLDAYDKDGKYITAKKYEQNIKTLEEQAEKAKAIADKYDAAIKKNQELHKNLDNKKEFFTDYIHNQKDYTVSGNDYTHR